MLIKVLTLVLVFSVSESLGQTIIWGPYSGGSAPAGWTFSNNVSTNAIDQGSYWLVDAGSPSDKITTASYNLCPYASAVVCYSVASFGSGVFNTLKVEVSYDGGSTYTDVFTSSTTTGSSYNAQDCHTLSQVTASVVIRISNNGTSGRGVRVQGFKLTASGSGSCTPTCTAPTTTITPTTQTVCAGSVTTISVSSSAASNTYIWQASATSGGVYSNVSNNSPSGASYTGTNTAVLTLTAGSTYYYRCLVAEGGTCTATSATSTLVVNTAPSVTTPTISSANSCEGSTNVSVKINASGSTPLSYQWQVSSGSGYFNVSGAAYTGGTTNTLTIGNSITAGTYSFQCIVTNACGSATSAVSSHTVVAVPAAPPIPTTAIANPSCGSNTVTAMTSTVSGVNWYWEATAAAVSTANSSSSQTVIATTSTVYVKAISGVGACASSASSLIVTIGTPVTLTGAAQTKNLCLGSSTTFTSNGSGTSTKYWQYSADGGVTYTVVPGDAVHSGTNLATLTLSTPPLTLNGYLYQMVVNEPGCPLVTSATSTLYVNAIPAAPPTPSAIANPACNSTSLAAMSSTVSGVVWYWEGSSSSGTSTVNPTSSNSPVINTSGVYYVRAFAGSCSSATSSSISVTILTSPAVTSQPGSVSTTSTSSASFSATVSGGNISYQWYENNGSGFLSISNGGSNPTYAGATSSVLTVSNPPPSMDSYSYQCVAINACGTTTTNGSAVLYISVGTTSCSISGAMAPAPNNLLGCASSCNLQSIYSTYGTFCNGTSEGTTFASTSMSNVFNIGSDCTASIIAEYKNRGGSCTSSGMDAGSDALYIKQSGGTVISESSTLDIISASCGAPFSGIGTYTSSVASITLSCQNGVGKVNMILTGGTFTVGGASNRGDEIITYTVNLSGSCMSTCATLLPIELLDFYATQNGDKNDVLWKVAGEDNIQSYSVEKSEDGINFREFNNQKPKGINSGTFVYLAEDYYPADGITYYRLTTIEGNWSIKNLKVVSLDRSSKEWKPLIYQEKNNLYLEFKNSIPKNSTISLFDLSGKLLVEEAIKDSQTKINTQNFADGIYFMRISTPYKTENFKIIIQK